MALLMHLLLFGSLIVVIDFGDRARPAVPLAIKGTLVTDNAIVIPPKVEEVVPQAPDTSEQDRLRAEEQKRQEDARIEQDRLNRIKQQEAARKKAEAVAERKRLADAEQRRKEREAETERKRIEAQRAREAEIDRRRLENERLRAAAQAAREAEIDAETNRLDALAANAETIYMFAIQQRISRNWVKPPTATAGIECVVNIRQLPGGDVVSVTIGRCNGDAVVRRSIEAAVHRASPLPAPADPSVFDRDIRLTFRPED
jgi:colicin import membrane protein